MICSSTYIPNYIIDVELADMLNDPEEFRKILVQNMSISDDLADLLLKSKVHGTEVNYNDFVNKH